MGKKKTRRSSTKKEQAAIEIDDSGDDMELEENGNEESDESSSPSDNSANLKTPSPSKKNPLKVKIRLGSKNSEQTSSPATSTQTVQESSSNGSRKRKSLPSYKEDSESETTEEAQEKAKEDDNADNQKHISPDTKRKRKTTSTSSKDTPQQESEDANAKSVKLKVKLASPSSASHDTPAKSNKKSSHFSPNTISINSLLRIVQFIREEDKLGMFWLPVSEEDVPGYYDIISNPISLSDIHSRVQKNIYKTFGQFKTDCEQMFENAFGFNPRSSVFYQQATILHQLFQQFCSHLSNKLLVTTQSAEYEVENVVEIIENLDRTPPIILETPKKQSKQKPSATPAKLETKKEESDEEDGVFAVPKQTPSKQSQKKKKAVKNDSEDDDTDAAVDEDEDKSPQSKKFIPKKESKDKLKPPAYERKRLYVELVNKLREEDKMKIFYEAVPKDTIGYFDIIKNPMDFLSLEKKSMQSKIVTLEDYKHNLELIFRNAMKFNEKNSVIYKEAERLLDIAVSYYGWLDEELEKAAKEFALNPKPTPKKEKKKEEEVSETPSKKDKKGTEEDESAILPSRLRKRDDKKQDDAENLDSGRSLRNRVVTPSARRDEAERTEMPELTDSQLQELMPLVINRIQASDIYDLYEKPVDIDEFPDYLDKVDEPMDFPTLKANVESEEYNDWQSFEHALESIFQNAKHYHPNDSFLYRDAHRIYRFWRGKVRKGIISELRDGIPPKEIRVLQVPRKAGAITVVALTPKAVADGYGVREYGGKDRAPLSKFLKELIEDFIAQDKNKTFLYPDAKTADSEDQGSSSSKSDAYPMDFCTLRKKIKLEKYRSFDNFKQDFENLLSTVMKQHKSGTTTYREAKKLLEYSEDKFKSVRARFTEEKPFIIEDKEDFSSPVYGIASSSASSQSTRKSVRTPLPGNRRESVSKPTFATPSKPPPRRIPIPPPTPFTPKTPMESSYPPTPQINGTSQSFFQTPITPSIAPPETPAPTSQAPNIQYITTPSYLFVDLPVHETFRGRYYVENSGLMKPFDIPDKVVIKKKFTQQVSDISTEEFENILNSNLFEFAASRLKSIEDVKKQMQQFVSSHQQPTISEVPSFESLLAEVAENLNYSTNGHSEEEKTTDVESYMRILAKNDTSDTFSQIVKDLNEVTEEDAKNVNMVEAKEYLEKLQVIVPSDMEQKKTIPIGGPLFSTQEESVTIDDKNTLSLGNHNTNEEDRELSNISTILDSTHTDDTAMMLLEDSEKQFL